MSSYNPTAGIRNLGPHVECFDMKVKDFIKLGGQLATPTGAADHTSVLYMDSSDRLTVKLNSNTASYVATSSTASNTSPTFTGMNIPSVTATENAATTLTTAQSGITVFCPQSTHNNSSSVNVINLPAPTTSGLKYKIVFTSAGDNTSAHGWQITSTGANMLGVTVSVAAGLVPVVRTASTNLIRNGVAADTKAGDYVELVSDGTNYYFYGAAFGVASPWSVS
jgi:hypothetical protein